MAADQDEAYADVNKASREANEIRDRWLKQRAHQCQRTQCDVVSHFTCAVPVSSWCSSATDVRNSGRTGSFKTQVAPGEAEHTLFKTYREQTCRMTIFEQSVEKKTVRHDVEATCTCPFPAASASQWREPCSMHGDDAHAAGTRMVWACEHGLRTGVVCNAGWLRAWLVDRCSNKDARKSERKTPTTCPTDRQSENEKEREDKRKRKERGRDNQQTAHNVAF